MKAFALVALGSLCLQLGSASASFAFSGLGVSTVASLRWLVAASLMLVAVRPKVRGRSRFSWTIIVAFGICMATTNLLFYGAISRMPLGNAVTIQYLGPCVVALIGSRKITEAGWAVAALAGVALVARPVGYFDLWGLVLSLGAATTLGAYTVLAGKLGREHSTSSDVALAMGVAALATLPLGLPRVSVPTARDWGLIALAALLAGILTNLLDAMAAKRTTSRGMGLFLAMDPLMAIPVGMLLLSQVPSAVELVGMVLAISAGTAMVWTSGNSVSPSKTGTIRSESDSP